MIKKGLLVGFIAAFMIVSVHHSAVAASNSNKAFSVHLVSMPIINVDWSKVKSMTLTIEGRDKKPIIQKVIMLRALIQRAYVPISKDYRYDRATITIIKKNGESFVMSRPLNGVLGAHFSKYDPYPLMFVIPDGKLDERMEKFVSSKKPVKSTKTSQKTIGNIKKMIEVKINQNKKGQYSVYLMKGAQKHPTHRVWFQFTKHRHLALVDGSNVDHKNRGVFFDLNLEPESPKEGRIDLSILVHGIKDNRLKLVKINAKEGAGIGAWQNTITYDGETKLKILNIPYRIVNIP